MKTTSSLLLLATFILVVVVPGRILAFRSAIIPTGTRKVSSCLRTTSLFFNPHPRAVSESRQSALFVGVNSRPSAGEDESSDSANHDYVNNHNQEWRQRIFRRSGIVMQRLMNPLQFANIDDDDKHQVLLAGSGSGVGGASKVIKSIWGRIKKLHDPKVYMILSIAAGLRWNWMFRSIFYWFGFGFLIKWYRARYVFKIPVWDRQPNWNNVITSKEQEKDLRALTCKNCGSTLFIAKSREFFFEGSTGIGGLGCFTCGAKGKDNFIEDRDRIVEDVADMDDYFEYERPLDLVSAYERRKLLKETKGDEEKANQILSARMESSNTTDTNADDAAATSTVDAPETTEVVESTEDTVPPPAEEEEEKPAEKEPQHQQPEAVVEEPKKTSLPPPPPPKPKPPMQPPAPKSALGSSLRRSKPATLISDSSSSAVNDDDLDLLGMDDF